MKKFITAAIAVGLIFTQSARAFSVSADSAGAAILIHAETGEILFEKNSSEQMLIASTTKIMTALVVLENCELDEHVLIKQEYTGIEGSSMYLEAGRIFTVEDLLYGLLLASGNDAATALAHHVAGGIEEFAELMNDKATELNLENTQFKNPHGLDAEGHYSSAFDLSIIMNEALKNEDFCEINGSGSVVIGELTFVNHNKLIRSYDGCIGGKTGYTIASGRSLVSAAERDGLKLICVTISDPDDWNTHATLYDWAFENYIAQELSIDNRNIELISGMSDTIEVGTIEKPVILLPKDSIFSLVIELPTFLYAPVYENSVVGKLTLTVGEELVGESEIVALESAELDEEIKLNFWERFLILFTRFNGLGIYHS